MCRELGTFRVVKLFIQGNGRGGGGSGGWPRWNSYSHKFDYCLAFTSDCSLEIDATCTLLRPCRSYLVSWNFNLCLTKKALEIMGVRIL